MKIVVLIICTVMNAPVFSQVENSQSLDHQNRKLNFEMNFIGLGAGIFNSTTDGSIKSENRYLIQNYNNTSFSCGLFEFRTLYKDRIGVTLGFTFTQTTINADRIANNLSNGTPGYVVAFDTSDQSGMLPIYGQFSPIGFDGGIVGKWNLNQISFLPYVSYQLSLAKNKYRFDAQYTDLLSGDSFERNSKVTESIMNGVRFGLDIRYNFERLVFLGLKGMYSMYWMEGESHYSDTMPTGTEYSEPEKYSRKANTLLFQAFVGVRFP